MSDDERNPTTGEDALRRAYLAAARAIEATRDPDEAFTRATALRVAADEIVGEAATLRARMAYRIWRTEQMSLARLAHRLGTSKSRADQLVRAARAVEPEKGEDMKCVP